MSNVRKIDDYKKVLAVEGYSDQVFLAEVLEHLGKIDETLEVDPNRWTVIAVD